MLEVKHAATYILLVKDELGAWVSIEEENKSPIANQFKSLLTDKSLGKGEQKRASNLVKDCRPKFV